MKLLSVAWKGEGKTEVRGRNQEGNKKECYEVLSKWVAKRHGTILFISSLLRKYK